jgi:dinuclear metal center YbgI/SA1388 family protein
MSTNIETIMPQRDAIIHYLNQYLAIDSIKDYSPVGLQVEGREQVNRIVTGVSASAELFQRAADLKADMVIVHHGMLWDRDPRVVRGSLKKRLQILLQNEITLLGYHLVLDKHAEIGNNAMAAKAFAMSDISPLGEVGVQGTVGPWTLAEVVQKAEQLFGQPPVVFGYGPATIQRMGFCSGGGEFVLPEAVAAGLDLYITGEAKESTMHSAKETAIHFLAAGHYATERLGIRALGEHVAEKFGIEVCFIDIPNPI